MKNEDGRSMTDKEILHDALVHLSEACCFLFEIESPEGKAAAFMADCALRYAQAVYKGNDPRLSDEFLENNKE